MTCIDLRERFGRKYKIGRDQAYYAQYGRRARVHDPWYDLVLCRHGEIFPWGGRLLAASTTKNGPVANRLRAAGFCRVVQDGDDGVTAVFDLNDFPKVAAIMRPRHRRTAPPALQELNEVRRQMAQKPHTGAQESERESLLST